MKIGHYYENGKSNFRVFAPTKRRVELYLVDEDKYIKMNKDELGYWCVEVDRLEDKTRYMYSVNGKNFPDPASRYQPEGVHKPSIVVENTLNSISKEWKGIKQENWIIYELHLGTFTKNGTLKEATGKLDYLKELGITVIELLPINAFPGERNWGYDGAYQFAIQNSYGTVEDLKEFIVEAHKRGMAVILDIVYNHFGPEGNYSGVYGPYIKKADTPWGGAINFDEAYSHGIRDFFMENIRYWLEEIKFDGFRMDAVLFIFDNSPKHILREIVDEVKKISDRENREIIMIAEHLKNDNGVTNEKKYNYDSQWNDDLNYAIFSCLTEEKTSYLKNFKGIEDLLKALKEGFVMDGTRFCKKTKKFRGSKGDITHPLEHVVHTQNHDQVGNRPLGDRFIATYGVEKALLATTTMMVSPFIPMLFQGEEYGEVNPFLFFTDFGDERVIRGVREGRKREFSFEGVEVPDPQSIKTFEDSKLNWKTLEKDENKRIFEYYKLLLKLRREKLIGSYSENYAVENEDDLIIVKTHKTISYLNYSLKDKEVVLENELIGTFDEKLSYEKGKLLIRSYNGYIVKK